MLKSFSWLIDGDCAMKSLDKSALLNKETGIPKDIAYFFALDEETQRERWQIKLLYQDVEYVASIIVDPSGRFRMKWKKDFAAKLYYKFSGYAQLLEQGHTMTNSEAPLMRFKSIDSDIYEVDLFNLDVEHEQNILEEGAQLQYLLTRYERSSIAREQAIAIHGYNCVACNFNFQQTYGELGRNFIEIHHVNPLSHVKAVQQINPAIDLVPLCANCHRMVHREWMRVIGIDELRELLKSKN